MIRFESIMSPRPAPSSSPEITTPQLVGREWTDVSLVEEEQLFEILPVLLNPVAIATAADRAQVAANPIVLNS